MGVLPLLKFGTVSGVVAGLVLGRLGHLGVPLDTGEAFVGSRDGLRGSGVVVRVGDGLLEGLLAIRRFDREVVLGFVLGALSHLLLVPGFRLLDVL